MTSDCGGDAIQRLLRECAPRVVAVLVRRHGDFDAAEDAVQEALIAAAAKWPTEGIPDNPRGWLYRAATRRLADQARSDAARRRREDAAAPWSSDPRGTPAPDDGIDGERDDTLTLLFMCCHPTLTTASAIALTLRAVGGLTTAEIARAFLVPEATMAQRISRAKQQIRASGVGFEMPGEGERAARLGAVLHVVYLIFNEGYASSAGPDLQRTQLADEAIRLARMLRRLLPRDGEVAGLLALMLLTDARRDARTGPAGELIPLDEQDRTRWNRALIEEGVALVTEALRLRSVGPYQLQAAIAAVHGEAPRFEDTDWTQIVALYELLLQMTDNPMVALNRAVAVAMVRGPAAGLELLAALGADPRIAEHHRMEAVRGHLLEMAGETTRARASYLAAADRTPSLPERHYLLTRAARIGPAATAADAGRTP